MSLNSKGKRIDEDLATVSVRKSSQIGKYIISSFDEIFDGLISH